MAIAIIDGIATHYEVLGSGPPLLMFSPGGFNAAMEKWDTQGIYADIGFLEQLPQHHTCIVFDRRESGRSGGRVERISWCLYAAQGKGLLDHLGIDKAFLMGGCMGCSIVTAFGAAYPETTLGMILFWPVGGVRYRLAACQRFAEHLAFVREHGLAAVVDLAMKGDKTFGVDPKGGPWASVIRGDPDFADRYLRQDPDRYRTVVTGMARTLFDQDTAPGAEPEDLLGLDIPTLIVPGADASHSTAAARYLEECIEGAQYLNLPVSDQGSPETASRVLEFLQQAGAGAAAAELRKAHSRPLR